jgi:predicted DNA-binding ribbon-helix-helix protein
MPSHNRKRSIKLAGRKTSISIEDEFWDSIQEIAALEGISIPDLISEIDDARQERILVSAIRLFVLRRSNQSTTSFGGCVVQLIRLARAKTPASEALGKMLDCINLYLATFGDPNVQFYERCRVRIAFAGRAPTNDLTIQFLKTVDKL